MPKLSQEALEARRGRIEEAARELFIKRGFHATSMRDIAHGAETSRGNLYNYYPTKEAILESIIGRYQKVTPSTSSPSTWPPTASAARSPAASTTRSARPRTRR